MKKKPTWIIAIFICSILSASVIPTMAATDNEQTQGTNEAVTSMAPYTGRLRVYVVEPVSRWNMYNGQPYHYGFLGFAVNEAISVEDTYTKSVTYNSDVSESNAMVIAVVFNSEPHQGYAYPPSGNPFTAYYTDATAAATPGNTGYNTVNEDFTHTVFVEEGTATWCPYCPAMANTLNAIYDSGDYPWYFVALVADMNGQAAARLSEYNLYGYPTAFFDGGYQVYVGGSSSESVYRTRIVTCGQREVPALNLSVSVEYVGSGDLQIDVNIATAGNAPPETPQTPSGDANGAIGTEYTYTTSTTDVNGDNVYYWFDWDDGTNSGWVGPYSSGETGSASHIWSEAGSYDVKVKAKDTDGAESGWSGIKQVTITAPSIELSIAGGLGKITATIKNIADTELTSIDWSITVKGGLLGLIDIQTTGIVDSLAASDQVSVTTDKFILGLGKIDVTATADTSTLTAQGVVFGPFISIK